MNGLFTDGLCTAAAIGKLLAVSEGDKSPATVNIAIHSSHLQQRTGRKGGQSGCQHW
jgi:hypothetical protein